MYDHMYNFFTGILKMTEEFNKGVSDAHISYRFDDDYSGYTGTYNIAAAAGDGTDSEKAKNLLFWLSGHISHYGNYFDEAGTLDSFGWFTYAFDKGPDHGINCLMLSQILAECLIALGIKARAVGLMPYSPYDDDCHFVTEAYCGDLGRWITLDPTYCLYSSDENGNVLSIAEIRERLANHEKLYFNKEANYNGTPIVEEDIETYYAKNFVYFRIGLDQGRNTQHWNEYEWLFVAPKHVDFMIRETENILWKDKSYGPADWIEERKANFEKVKSKIITAGFENIY